MRALRGLVAGLKKWLSLARGGGLEYLDVSATAEDRVDFVPEVVEALEGLDFRLIGLMEQKAATRSYVTEVIVDPDGVAFTRPEHLQGKPHLSFKTLLEDGTVVDTRNTHPIAILDRLPLFAPYQHHPAAGYLCENLGRAGPGELWVRHRERVRAVMAERRTRTRRHDMPLCLAAMNRSWEVTRRRVAVGVPAGWAATVLVSSAAMWAAPFFVAAGICLLALPVCFVLIGGEIARRWPVRRRPLAELVGGDPDRDASGRLLN